MVMIMEREDFKNMEDWKKEFNKKFKHLGILDKTQLKRFILKHLMAEYKEGYTNGWNIRDAIAIKDIE